MTCTHYQFEMNRGQLPGFYKLMAIDLLPRKVLLGQNWSYHQDGWEKKVHGQGDMIPSGMEQV
jgi:hypothetical protein